MKRIAAVIASLMLCCLLLAGCVRIMDHEDMKVIGVIAKGDSTAYWLAVLAGAEDAAIENGYAITFRGTETMGPESVLKQQEIMHLALDNEVCGMVAATVGDGFADMLAEAKQRHIPVIEFDSGIWEADRALLDRNKTNPIVASVYTRNYQAARISADHLYNYIRKNIAASEEPYVVGIIQHDLSSSGVDRADGFTDRFQELCDFHRDTRGKAVVTRIVRTGAARNNYAKALGHLRERGVSAVFMTSADVVDQVYDEVQKTGSLYQNVIFTGFDAGNKQLAWLRSDAGPVLIGSVTQDAYAIGYEAVTQCINAMEARGVTAYVEIPALWYDRNNLENLSRKNLLEEG